MKLGKTFEYGVLKKMKSNRLWFFCPDLLHAPNNLIFVNCFYNLGCSFILLLCTCRCNNPCSLAGFSSCTLNFCAETIMSPEKVNKNYYRNN